MRGVLLVVALSACSRSREPEVPPPDPTGRAKTYVAGDPAPKLARMRENATALGCKVEERTAGTLFACGDVDIWVVPDPNGMEVTCTGLPVNCNKRGRELTRQEADAG